MERAYDVRFRRRVSDIRQCVQALIQANLLSERRTVYQQMYLFLNLGC